jgi:tetratricopeptide (TPR) repeat protein
MSLRIAQLIQKQVPLGSRLVITLKTGQSVEGQFAELARDYVVIERNGNPTTVLLDMIGAWGVDEQEESPDHSSEAALVPPLQHDVIPAISDQQDNGADGVRHEVVSSNGQGTIKTGPPQTDDEAVLKVLIEIETRYDTQIRNGRVDVQPPEFDVSKDDLIQKAPGKDLKTQGDKKALQQWGRIVDRYNYARRVNELGSQFGRVQPIITDLEKLRDKLPKSAVIRNLLGYLYYLSGDKAAAQDAFRASAQISPNAGVWRNLAAVAMETGNQALACYALEQIFALSSSDEKSNEWFVYVGLLTTLRDYSSLKKVFAVSGQNQNVVLIWEAAIYLIGREFGRDKARQAVFRWLSQSDLHELTNTTLDELERHSDAKSVSVMSGFASAPAAEGASSPKIEQAQTRRGQIYEYGRNGNFGFLRDENGKRFFFHRSAIADPILLKGIRRLGVGETIDVAFDPAEGPERPLALSISMIRTVDELYLLATKFAAEANYPQAISFIKQVLNRDAGYRDAAELHERWREYARVSGVPSGSNPYARARRVQLIEKDLDRAAKLFRQAIKEKDNAESAVKDLAQLLVQQGRTDQAIELLQQERKVIQDQQSVDNLLVGFYQKAGRNEEAIGILRNRLSKEQKPEKTISLRWQIGYLYLQSQQYSEALKELNEIKRLQPANLTVQRNIAVCYFNLGDHDRAEAVLKGILDKTIDSRASELLSAIQEAKRSGQFDEIIVSINMSDLSGEISRFVQFQLENSEFQGMPPDKVQNQEFNESDIQQLEQLATQLGTRRPKDRAGFYLSAAKVTAIIEGENTSRFYTHLCRSLTSYGDATIAEGRPLASARAYYCEALMAVDRTLNTAEPDAMKAIIRYLFTFLGAGNVPLTSQIPSIEDAIAKALVDHPQRDFVLENIAYLIFYSSFAATKILRPLFSAATLRAITLRYLEQHGIVILQQPRQFDEFIHLWNELRLHKFEKWRNLPDEFRFLKKGGFIAASLENGIRRLKDLAPQMLNDLDQKRTHDLIGVFEIGLDLVKQTAFEERERLCIQIDGRCDELLREIETNPTKFSIEEMHDVVSTLRKKTASYLDELYVSSTPQVDIHLPIESYAPDANRRIDVQLAVANKMGRSPAEALELVVRPDDRYYYKPNETQLEGSLRGGEQQILVVSIQLKEESIRGETFSLPVQARYSTRSDKLELTPVSNFSIRLYPESEFERIDNPYSWAEGGTVSDASMFYGREELILNIASVIQSPNAIGKSIIVFGQKRAGKSSILYHLKQRLIQDHRTLVLDVGNIGSILDKQSATPFLYQILWSILTNLQYAIEDATVDNVKPPLSLSFPTDREFYTHPSPLTYFRDLWTQFKRETSRTERWQECKVVLLIDEFSYLFAEIIQGHIPDSFMKNWKAILQEGWFCAVLAGQDDMPRFKQRFPNEFGTTQDERVTYLKREDAEKLIDEPIRIGGRSGESRYREQAIDRIIDLTAGSPFYIQILCNRLVEHMNRRKARLVTEADVEQVKNDLVRGVNALSFDKFENLINSGDETSSPIPNDDIHNVLKTIAANSRIGLCNRSTITCKTTTPIDEILDDLVKRDVIERERGQYYRIRVGLFKEWLLANG